MLDTQGNAKNIYRKMQCADESLKAAFLPGYGAVSHGDEESEDDTTKTSNHLLYLGKADLPQHPVRMRYLPYSTQRFLLYGKSGHQEIIATHAPQFYSLKKISHLVKITDCVQTSDKRIYTIARSHSSAMLARYDSSMAREKIVEVPYPQGCLSSLVINHNCTYLYGTNLELNCVQRFTCDDLGLSKAERFGALWRPFDCCTSQVFPKGTGGEGFQFLFVSNLDAGICAFNMDTMEIVADCGDDLLPGAKYLAYDAKRSFLFVSCSCERLLRCYRFTTKGANVYEGGDSAPPSLQKIGDFLVANRKPSVRSSGPQCVMWDPDMDQLAVISWSHVKGKFSNKVFRVNI